MALIDWNLYSKLLEDLNFQSSKWKSSKNYVEFADAIKLSCPELLAGDNGLTSLEALILDNVSEQDEVYAQVRLAALAVPAELTPLGQDWAGWFISSRPDGHELCSRDRYAVPSAWEEIDEDDDSDEDEPGDEEELEGPESGLQRDEATGLLYDELNWYLPDDKKIVTQVGNSDIFTDAEGTRYRKAVAFQWLDPGTKLLFDDVNWYLADGTTIVTQVGDTDVYADSISGTRYRLGVAFQWFDSETRLLYDDVNWYLANGTTAVTQVGDTDVYADDLGRKYRLGQLIPEPVIPAPEPGAEPASVAEAEITEVVRVSMEESIEAAIKEIRELDIGEDELSEADIAELVAEAVQDLVLLEIDGG